MNALITAAMDMTNLLYVLGAVVVATMVSALLILRHRRPKSLEAGIEMFSKELKALEPERGGPPAKEGGRAAPATRSKDLTLRPVAPSGITPRRRVSGLLSTTGAGSAAPGEDRGRNEAEAAAPDWEDQSG